MHSHSRHRASLAGVLLLLAALFATPVPAQGQVRIVVDRDFVNVRIVPALGAELAGTANAGTVFVATGRSPDNEWLQIQFAGQEAWIGVAVVVVLEGDVNSLPVRDPRSIPYGGREAPRAGFTTATSDFLARLPDTGVRVRSGPSTAYVVLADAPRFSEFPLLGRTPNNQYVQVNFQGTLGWIPVQYIEIIGNRTLLELPIDGVVAEEPPLSFENENAFFGILRRMRDRLDLAQPSLNSIQATWTDAGLGIAPICAAYPARPSNFNIPRAIYAEYFALLDPLLIDFNSAMTDLRASIDLLIEACGRPNPTPVLISPPVVTGGLELANAADAKIASLRRRIDELLPELGPDDCVFAFSGRVDVLPALAPLSPFTVEVVTDAFTPSELTKGYCFDATQINVGRIELVRAETNYGVIIAVAPLDDPTNFIATASAGPSTFEGVNVIVFPISFPRDGRYLIIVDAEIEPDETPQGEYTLLLTDFSFGTPSNSFLAIDEDGNVVFQDVPYTTEGGGSGTVTVEDGQLVEEGGDQGGGGDTGDDPVQPGETITNEGPDAPNIYAAPDFNSNVVGAWGIGVTLEVLDVITGNWYFVELPDGLQGWVNIPPEELNTTNVQAGAPAGVPANGTRSVAPPTSVAPPPVAATLPPIPTSPAPGGDNPFLPRPTPTPGLASTPVSAVCPGLTLTCDELFSCVEVQGCINAGSTVLDPNGNGIACDGNDGFNPLGCNVAVP